MQAPTYEGSPFQKSNGQPEFSLAIITRNRKEDLRLTLGRTLEWFSTVKNEILVYDDASTDGTYSDLRNEFPQVRWFCGHSQVGGSIARRNLYSHVRGKIILGLDDDAEILSRNVCDLVQNYFANDNRCGIISFRIYWGKGLPSSVHDLLDNNDPPFICRDFGAGACAIRRACYLDIDGYPDWLKNIYGEETVLSVNAYRLGWTVHYLPAVLVHHRVDTEARKKDRKRRYFSFKSQLSNQLKIAAICYPLRKLPNFYFRILWHNFWKYAVRSKMYIPYLASVWNFLCQVPIIIRNRKPLSTEQYIAWSSLPPPVYYWQPEKTFRDSKSVLCK
jgi:GT2 family glycosyltransferase